MKGIYWSCQAFVGYVPRNRIVVYEKGYRTMNNTLPMSFVALFVLATLPTLFVAKCAFDPSTLDLFVVRYICDVSPLLTSHTYITHDGTTVCISIYPHVLFIRILACVSGSVISEPPHIPDGQTILDN